ncbi:common plant regulatory factor 1-like isoform X2 [Mercurialis annua]|uniref:common plant regulatory factor 1-like isoform X2 n=1 Tax=Mercurialis annua TaxID=3986 RepID=UPI00215E7205|nr:common plant regulatory factor 1-like isoform X2 [Mercurialis annua]
MGNSDDGKSAKPEKLSSPAPPDQANIHVYPDWAAMQAYYGPRVALPPYYNSAMASGHAPHPYMWGAPQHMMPPYAPAYAAVYPHGGVYAHPAVPVAVSHPEVGKSAENGDRGLIKKLKGFDGLAMSIGNSNNKAESAEGGERRLSQSSETEGSTDGSDGNTAGGRKRRREVTSSDGEERRTGTHVNSLLTRGANTSSDKSMVAATGVSGKSVGAIISPGMNTALELQNSPANSNKTNDANAQPCAVLPPEVWVHNERELKRERRKQSNRESARRSRLRKQAEAEELSRKVESLTSENLTLKSEIHQMSEKSEKLRLENAALLEKLKNADVEQTREIMLSSSDVPRASAVSTENLLSRVENSASGHRNTGEDDGDIYERSSNSGAKLHQLLGTSPRADAVAAG